MDFVQAFTVAGQGMVDAWNMAQEFFDANRGESGELKEGAVQTYQFLLERVEQFHKQIARLEHALKVECDIK